MLHIGSMSRRLNKLVWLFLEHDFSKLTNHCALPVLLTSIRTLRTAMAKRYINLLLVIGSTK